jgi:hypothetical protein
MAGALEARLSRLEARSDQAPKKFIVVGGEAERDALVQAGRVSADVTVIITGVPRTRATS